jgi:hypothetical protein
MTIAAFVLGTILGFAITLGAIVVLSVAWEEP